jgi:hypothetical protein
VAEGNAYDADTTAHVRRRRAGRKMAQQTLSNIGQWAR